MWSMIALVARGRFDPTRYQTAPPRTSIIATAPSAVKPREAQVLCGLRVSCLTICEARWLMTHPGAGPLTALAFVQIIGEAHRFQCGKQVASYLGLVPLEDSSGNRRRLGHITKQGSRCCVSCWGKRLRVTVRSLPEWRSKYFHLMMRRGRKIAKVATWRGGWPVVCTGCGARDGITSK
jgi:transposase